MRESLVSTLALSDLRLSAIARAYRLGDLRTADLWCDTVHYLLTAIAAIASRGSSRSERYFVRDTNVQFLAPSRGTSWTLVQVGDAPRALEEIGGRHSGDIQSEILSSISSCKPLASDLITLSGISIMRNSKRTHILNKAYT